MKYYTHASLFPPLFKTWPIVSNRVTFFVVHPPCRPLPFARFIDFTLLSLPSKMAKGWAGSSTGFFDFRAERNAFIRTSTGYKGIFSKAVETPD